MNMNDRIALELGRALLRAILAEGQVAQLAEELETCKAVAEAAAASAKPASSE